MTQRPRKFGVGTNRMCPVFVFLAHTHSSIYQKRGAQNFRRGQWYAHSSVSLRTGLPTDFITVSPNIFSTLETSFSTKGAPHLLLNGLSSNLTLRMDQMMKKKKIMNKPPSSQSLIQPLMQNDPSVPSKL